MRGGSAERIRPISIQRVYWGCDGSDSQWHCVFFFSVSKTDELVKNGRQRDGFPERETERTFRQNAEESYCERLRTTSCCIPQQYWFFEWDSKNEDLTLASCLKACKAIHFHWALCKSHRGSAQDGEMQTRSGLNRVWNISLRGLQTTDSLLLFKRPKFSTLWTMHCTNSHTQSGAKIIEQIPSTNTVLLCCRSNCISMLTPMC